MISVRRWSRSWLSGTWPKGPLDNGTDAHVRRHQSHSFANYGRERLLLSPDARISSRLDTDPC